MTEKDFLQAIINDPDDDVPRLIFADWLEEHENQERAEFIRLQVERVRDPSGDASRPTLIERERQLLGRHQQRWLAELPQLADVTWGRSFRGVDWHDFHRGFLFKAGFKDFADFTRHARTIREATTVRSLCFQLPGHVNDMSRRWPAELLSFLKSPHLEAFAHLQILPNGTIRFGMEGIRMLAASYNLGGLSTLDLSHHALGDEGVALLAVSPRFSQLTELALGDNDLTTQGLYALAQSPHLTQLRALDLSPHNSMDDEHSNRFDAAGVAALAASANFRRLRSLSLEFAGLDDDSATSLANGSLPGLRSLSLSWNKISAIGVRAMARSQFLADLRELRMFSNPLGTAGAVALIKTAPLQHLHSLDLAATRLGPEAVYVLGGSAVGQRLEYLNLQGNPIGVEGMKFFLERQFWPNLLWLGLSYRPHERDAAESLKECWGERVVLSFQTHDYQQ